MHTGASLRHAYGTVDAMRTTLDKAGRLVIPAAGAPLTGAAVRELIDADRHGR